MWLNHQLLQGANRAALNSGGAVLLSGDKNETAHGSNTVSSMSREQVIGALWAAVREQEILRTTFHNDDTEPFVNNRQPYARVHSLNGQAASEQSLASFVRLEAMTEPQSLEEVDR